MRGYIDGLVAQYGRTGVLVDANLLILYVVGRTDARQIERFGRTHTFTGEDYALLARFLKRFAKMVVTPHVLTEVSNMIGEPEDLFRKRCFQVVADLVGRFIEVYVPSAEIVQADEFRVFGLSDAAIALIARRESYLVLTSDLPLWHFLSNTGVAALNFNHMRLI
ncbi:MAG: hypothetical protein IT323_02880 [Anaerolineae bacterium]|nr:hypothetical protein [Anaerolineae bacterium]